MNGLFNDLLSFLLTSIFSMQEQEESEEKQYVTHEDSMRSRSSSGRSRSSSGRSRSHCSGSRSAHKTLKYVLRDKSSVESCHILDVEYLYLPNKQTTIIKPSKDPKFYSSRFQSS